MEGSGYNLDGLRRRMKAAQSKREQVNLCPGGLDIYLVERLYLEWSSLTYVRPGQSFVSRSPWSS